MSRPALDQVSVVIVSWNVRDQLQKALELLAPSPELEVIVVDNEPISQLKPLKVY